MNRDSTSSGGEHLAGETGLLEGFLDLLESLLKRLLHVDTELAAGLALSGLSLL